MIIQVSKIVFIYLDTLQVFENSYTYIHIRLSPAIATLYTHVKERLRHTRTIKMLVLTCMCVLPWLTPSGNNLSHIL